MINRYEIISALVEKKISSTQDIKGCSESEIAGIEEFCHAKLPSQYRDFLLAIGHSGGKLFQGTDIYYRNLVGLQDAAKDLLKENGEDFDIPLDAFVFLMHQGYEFDYFRLSEGDDPPVYQYVEGHGEPQIAWKSFSKFLSESIESHFNTLS